jgi:O-antigen/teichoic acid export membrane protein
MNVASTGVGNVWAMVVMLVSLPLLLRGLGAAAFGTWVLVQTFSAVTGWISLADLGVGTATTRAVAERDAKNDTDGVGRTMSSALAVFVGVGVFCALALATAGQSFLPNLFNTPGHLHADLRVALVFFAVQVVIDLVTEGCEACLEGLQRVDLSRAADAVRRTAVAVATASVAMAGGGLRGVALASLLAAIVGMAAAAAMLRRVTPAGGRRPSLTVVRELLSYGRTVALLGPLGVLHRTIDRVVVGSVFGPSAVALVEIATQIMNAADAVLGAMSYAVLPSAAWLRARGDHDRLVELVERGTKYALLATLPAIGIGAILAGPIVHLWVGTRYGAAPGLASVALLYIGAAAPIQVGAQVLLGVGKAGVILRAAGAAIVVNVVASVVLVHAVGVVGVFQATLLAEAVVVPAVARAMLNEIGLSVGEFVRRAIVPTLAPMLALTVVASGAVLAPLGDLATLTLGGVGGLAVYAAITARTAVSRNELAEFRRLLSRAPA